jgi:uncharacterized protein YggE
MDEKGTLMRKLIPLFAAGVLVLAACGQEPQVTVNAGTDNGAGTGISVSGQGRVTGTPDTLRLNLGVSVLADSVDEATGEASRLAEALIAALTGNGVAEGDIQTSNYSIYPEWDYRDETQTLRGYRVTNSVDVKIRDLGRAGEIIDAATTAGGDAVVVNGVGFSIEDNTELLELARSRAWDDAEAKARQLAQLAGVELGAPLSIVESVGYQPPPVAFDRAEMADAATPIEPGQQEVSVNLEIRYAIAG